MECRWLRKPRHRASRAQWPDDLTSWLQKNLCRAAPTGDHARNPLGLAEILHVFLDLEREFVFIFAFFDVRAVELLDVLRVKGRLHRLDSGKKCLYLFEVLRI